MKSREEQLKEQLSNLKRIGEDFPTNSTETPIEFTNLSLEDVLDYAKINYEDYLEETGNSKTALGRAIDDNKIWYVENNYPEELFEEAFKKYLNLN